MRMLVFFDLPMVEPEDRRSYTQFHRFLTKSGFIMMQESVYCKLLLNATAAEAVAASLRKNKPDKGVVQMMCITEKQFARMEWIVGEHHSEIVDSGDRLVIL